VKKVQPKRTKSGKTIKTYELDIETVQKYLIVKWKMAKPTSEKSHYNFQNKDCALDVDEFMRILINMDSLYAIKSRMIIFPFLPF
jgi:hypothetical protein